jgi:hypothetical protein
MPRGPRDEKRPADVIGVAVMVAKMATGQLKRKKAQYPMAAAAEVGRRGGNPGR